MQGSARENDGDDAQPIPASLWSQEKKHCGEKYIPKGDVQERESSNDCRGPPETEKPRQSRKQDTAGAVFGMVDRGRERGISQRRIERDLKLPVISVLPSHQRIDRAEFRHRLPVKFRTG